MAELWSVYGGQLWRAMLVAAAGRRDLADDVTSEAFARLLANYDSVREPQAWLYRTGYRLLVDEYRRQRRVGSDPPEAEAVIAAELDPELVTALSRLDPKVRLCVFLHYFADLPVGEVAHLTGSTRTAVKVRLHRARAQLRVALTDVGGVHVPVD
jgi:RNA polymerase sigma-70 factor, ECF subfamily